MGEVTASRKTRCELKRSDEEGNEKMACGLKSTHLTMEESMGQTSDIHAQEREKTHRQITQLLVESANKKKYT